MNCFDINCKKCPKKEMYCITCTKWRPYGISKTDDFGDKYVKCYVCNKTTVNPTTK